MSRLSEKEIDVIRQARAASQRDASTRTDVYVAAREDRNDGFGRMIGKTVGTIARATGVADLVAAIDRLVLTPVRNGMTRRQTMSQLRRMDDRMLRDIGVERGTLYGLSEDLQQANVIETPARGGIFAWAARQLRRRSTLHELQGLDDRMLEDIGLTRGSLGTSVDTIIARETAAVETPKAQPRVPAEALSWLNMNRRLMTEIANLGPIMITPEGHMKTVKVTEKAA